MLELYNLTTVGFLNYSQGGAASSTIVPLQMTVMLWYGEKDGIGNMFGRGIDFAVEVEDVTVTVLPC